MSKDHKYVILILVSVSLIIMYSHSEGAGKIYGSVIVTEITDVYDGDTFKVNIDSWPDIVGKNVSIRIYGIDTPEMRGTKGEVRKLALRAKSFLVDVLLSGKTVELCNIRRGKYFRIVAEVYIDGKNLADLLIKKGLAKEYYGGKRPIW